MENRQIGYYWIKPTKDHDWQIAHYGNKSKDFFYAGTFMPEKDVFEINETPIQSPDADNTERGEIEDLAKSIDESGLKVTFGLQPKHLEVISETLKKWNTPIDIDGKSETPNMLYSQHFWNDCAKQIGWCPFTLSLYYFNWVQSQKPVHPTPPTLLNELRDCLHELLQVKQWKDTYGKDEKYLSAQPIAWKNAEEMLAKYDAIIQKHENK